jgi:hypothetical protein
MRQRLFTPRTLVFRAVEVYWSRCHGGRELLGSVRPKIWRVSRRECREIWKVGFSEASSSPESLLEVSDCGE